MATYKEIKQAVFLRDKGKCVYCGAEVDNDNFDLEHVHPRSRGGGNSISNLAVSCKKCNVMKYNRTPDEFKEYIKLRIFRPIHNGYYSQSERLLWAFASEEQFDKVCQIFLELEQALSDIEIVFHREKER